MTVPPTSTVLPTRRRTVLYGLAVGVAVGAAGTMGWWYWRERQRHALLKELATYLGNEDLDPDKNDAATILNEIQLTWNIDGDGKWNDATEAKIRELLAGDEPDGVAANPGSAPAPVPDARAELEPDQDWEEAYGDGIEGAIAEAMAEPQVVTFDQAVIYILTMTFPESGRFHANPDMGTWKQRARERTRQDLAQRVGHTEAEARAVLNARTVGASALQRGMSHGQAVRTMGEYAFPTARWEGPRSPWQQLFAKRAGAELAG